MFPLQQNETKNSELREYLIKLRSRAERICYSRESRALPEDVELVRDCREIMLMLTVLINVSRKNLPEQKLNALKVKIYWKKISYFDKFWDLKLFEPFTRDIVLRDKLRQFLSLH